MTSVTLSLIVEDKTLQEVWKQEIRRGSFLSVNSLILYMAHRRSPRAEEQHVHVLYRFSYLLLADCFLQKDLLRATTVLQRNVCDRSEHGRNWYDLVSSLALEPVPPEKASNVSAKLPVYTSQQQISQCDPVCCIFQHPVD